MSVDQTGPLKTKPGPCTKIKSGPPRSGKECSAKMIEEMMIDLPEEALCYIEID